MKNKVYYTYGFKYISNSDKQLTFSSNMKFKTLPDAKQYLESNIKNRHQIKEVVETWIDEIVIDRVLNNKYRDNKLMR